jgi:hypothetical protein
MFLRKLTDEEIKERALCFHSLKKYAVTITGKITNGNVTEMQKIGHHSDVRLTMGIYNKSTEDKSKSIGLLMDFSEKKEENLLEQLESLSKEELINKIMNCSEYIAREILNK